MRRWDDEGLAPRMAGGGRGGKERGQDGREGGREGVEEEGESNSWSFTY